MPRHCRGLAALLATAAPVVAQAQTVLALPVRSIPSGSFPATDEDGFGQPLATYACAGRASGPVGVGSGGTPILARFFGVDGLFALGRCTARGGSVPHPSPTMHVAAAFGVGPRFVTIADRQTVTGIRQVQNLTHRFTATFTAVVGATGQQARKNGLDLEYALVDFGTIFPREINVQIPFAAPGASGTDSTRGVTLDVTLAVVTPEPIVLPLVTLGGMLVGAVRVSRSRAVRVWVSAGPQSSQAPLQDRGGRPGPGSQVSGTPCRDAITTCVVGAVAEPFGGGFPFLSASPLHTRAASGRVEGGARRVGVGVRPARAGEDGTVRSRTRPPASRSEEPALRAYTRALRRSRQALPRGTRQQSTSVGGTRRSAVAHASGDPGARAYSVGALAGVARDGGSA